MKKEVSICLVVPSLQIGGMERVIVELGNYFALNDLFYQVHIITLTNKEIMFNLEKKVIVHKPEFDYKKYYRIIYTVKTFFYLRKKIKTIKPDVVLSFGDKFNSFVILSSLFLPPKIYISNRRNPYLSNGKAIDLINKITYRFAHGIIAQTSKAKEVINDKYFNKNVVVLPNPVRHIIAEHDQKQNIILNVGRFIGSKNQILLINFYAKIKNFEWKLIFCGDGPELEKAKTTAKALGVEKHVIFAGNQVDVDKFYKISKVFAFTSSSEGFPNVLAEAMSAGLSCISFDCFAGPSDLIDDGVNGYLIRENDYETYINRLGQLLNDKNLRQKFGNNAMKKVEALSVAVIAEKFYNFMMK